MDFVAYDRAALAVIQSWGGAASMAVAEDSVQLNSQFLQVSVDAVCQAGDVQGLQMLDGRQPACLANCSSSAVQAGRMRWHVLRST